MTRVYLIKGDIGSKGGRAEKIDRKRRKDAFKSSHI